VVILEQRIGAAGGLSALISIWQTALFTSLGLYTDKKENQIFLIYKEIQNGAVVKSYMTNGLIIYSKYLGKSSYVRTPFLIYDFVTAPLLISLYMRKIYTDKEILRAPVKNALLDCEVFDGKLIGMQSIGKASRQWTYVCKNVGIKKWPTTTVFH
jgi:hypothetical protein